MTKSREVEVHAGGGLVRRGDGALLVVHRPRYDDWTFPKGKQEAGETLEECALREVEEETGWACELVHLAAITHYIDQKGRYKQVTYWWMTPVSGAFEPNDEVDEVEWVSPMRADQILSYERDLDVLNTALGT